MTTGFKNCSHSGENKVKVGPYEVRLAKVSDIKPEVLSVVDILVPLNGSMPYAAKGAFGKKMTVYSAELQDHGGVPEGWAAFIDDVVMDLAAGKEVLAWCMGSHGRTGTFGASLIAKLEPEIEDPVAEIRARHCDNAVETLAQVKGVFAIKGTDVPQKYVDEFSVKSYTSNPSSVYGWPSYSSTPLNRGERAVIHLPCLGKDIAFEESSTGRYLVYNFDNKPVSELLKLKFLEIKGDFPTEEEMTVWNLDPSYIGFFRPNYTQKEVKFHGKYSAFVVSSDGVYFTYTHASESHNSEYIEFTGDEPTLDEYNEFFKDAKSRGFKKVKEKTKPSKATNKVVVLTATTPATINQVAKPSANPSQVLYRHMGTVMGKDSKEHQIYKISDDQEFVSVINGDVQYLVLMYEFDLMNYDLDNDKIWVDTKGGVLTEGHYDEFFNNYSMVGFKVPLEHMLNIPGSSKLTASSSSVTIN